MCGAYWWICTAWCDVSKFDDENFVTKKIRISYFLRVVAEFDSALKILKFKLKKIILLLYHQFDFKWYRWIWISLKMLNFKRIISSNEKNSTVIGLISLKISNHYLYSTNELQKKIWKHDIMCALYTLQW